MNGHLWLAFGIALALNLAWEFAHAHLYLNYRGHEITPALLVFMAVKDALIITILIYAQRSIALLHDAPIVIPAAALLIAVIVELHALQTGRWAYASAMPVLPFLGIGISPLAQMTLTSFLSYRFSV